MMPFRSLKTIVIAGLMTVLILTAAAATRSQEVVDKTVASVSDSNRAELITYSDLIWQLALQPNTPIDPPRKDDLNAALLRLIDQRLIALEAERLPRAAPTDLEIKGEINRILSYFPSTGVFIERLKRAGFESATDENFRRIVAQRLAIDKYIDFRFRSFIVITPDDEAKYYREIFVPDYQRKYKGLVTPTLTEKRAEINSILTEERVATRIESYLDDAKRRAEIEIISEPGN